MFGAHAQPILAKDFRDFCHRARPFESEIANNDERFVDQDPGSLFQFCKRNARIDIAIIIGASHHDVRRIMRGGVEKRANPVRRGSHFLNDLLELLNHPARFEDHFFSIGNLGAQIDQFLPNWIARRQRRNHTIE